MRIVKKLKDDWRFTKGRAVPADIDDLEKNGWQSVSVPHTYNARDGQDGGNDYYRGPATYVRVIKRPDVPDDWRIFIKFNAVNSVAEVYAQGAASEKAKRVAEHKGGYSAFTAEITECFDKTSNACMLSVIADNSYKSDVYPQAADFTFYGGIYRNVELIAVPKTHFAFGEWCAPALSFTTKLLNDRKDALVDCKARVAGAKESDMVCFTLYDNEGNTVAEICVPLSFSQGDKERNATTSETQNVEAQLFLRDAHLWQGVSDPYLYTVEASLIRHNEVIDRVWADCGIREFSVDAEKGFCLNGTYTPLRGVSRHQDMLGIGNALLERDHARDIAIIRELGANTVRLAHYQHSEDFYSLCDRVGFVVWAEIPFISAMSADAAAHENCRSQLHELILQNCTHPSICFWGIQNEITIATKETDELYERLVDLNALAKRLDPSRLTTMAQLSNLPKDSRLNTITDVLSYNHYFGWYVGTFDDNERWLDDFHKTYPDRALGVSEYGCEGIVSWHTDAPVCKDYTEEYQALYHEHMAKIIDERPYLWATHIWNMFDFGCDARNEGGVTGRNNKGLVSFDRKIFKDSFYVYKAHWAQTPFVHIAGRRYGERPGHSMNVKVYSNMNEVRLFVNGKKFAEKRGEYVFTFEDIPLETEWTEVSAELADGAELTRKSANKSDIVVTTFDRAQQENAVCSRDSVVFKRIDAPNPCYTRPREDDDGQREGVKNWFEDEAFAKDVGELTFNEDAFSIRDTVGDLLNNKDAERALFAAFEKMGINKGRISIWNAVPLENIAHMLAQNDEKAQRLAIRYINAELQKVKK